MSFDDYVEAVEAAEAAEAQPGLAAQRELARRAARRESRVVRAGVALGAKLARSCERVLLGILGRSASATAGAMAGFSCAAGVPSVVTALLCALGRDHPAAAESAAFWSARLAGYLPRFAATLTTCASQPLRGRRTGQPAGPHSRTGLAIPRPHSTSSPGPGSPLPTSAPGLGSPPAHICARIGRAPVVIALAGVGLQGVLHAVGGCRAGLFHARSVGAGRHDQSPRRADPPRVPGAVRSLRVRCGPTPSRSRRRCGRGEPSPGADVPGVSPRTRRGCGMGSAQMMEGGGAQRVLARTWQADRAVDEPLHDGVALDALLRPAAGADGAGGVGVRRTAWRAQTRADPPGACAAAAEPGAPLFIGWRI